MASSSNILNSMASYSANQQQAIQIAPIAQMMSNTMASTSNNPDSMASSSTNQQQTIQIAPIAQMMSYSMASTSNNPNNVATPANQAIPAVTFHLFGNLPQEIKDGIWKESVNNHPRVIILDHTRHQGVNDGGLVSRAKNIHEKIPALLHTCSDSRKVMLRLVEEKYHSVFKAPKLLGRFKLHYIGSLDRDEIWRIAFDLIGGHALGVNHSSLGFMAQINQHLNRYPPTTIPAYAAMLRREHGPLCPAYFDPVLDTLYIRTVGSRFDRQSPYFLSGLWAPSSIHDMVAIEKVAIELDHRVYASAPHDRNLRLWLNLPAYRFSRALEKIYLVCLNDKEVIEISFDQSGTLANDQWVFSLETNSPLFKDEMGSNWTGVLWKVELRKGVGMKLWQCARAWNCAAVKWEKRKRSVCQGNQGVPTEWFDTVRVRGVKEKGRRAQGWEAAPYAARGPGWFRGNFPGVGFRI